MNEIFPIAGGVLLGAALGAFPPRLRIRIGAPLAVLLGTLATVLSGEFRLSWAFLLVDVPLVVSAAAIGLLAVHRLRWSRKQPQGS